MNGHILVDCGPHTPGSLAIAGAPLASVTDIFVTHLHDDHFDAENIGRIASAKEENSAFGYGRTHRLPRSRIPKSGVCASGSAMTRGTGPR